MEENRGNTEACGGDAESGGGGSGCEGVGDDEAPPRNLRTPFMAASSEAAAGGGGGW